VRRLVNALLRLVDRVAELDQRTAVRAAERPHTK
jgi:hypothetical protein